MKKTIILFLSFIFFYGCSTSNDSNGNSTTTAVPVTPSNLTGLVISPTQINLSWTDNSTNETGFKIERRTGTGNYNIVGTVNADVLTFSDSGLTASTTYTYRVYSYNAVGNSPTYSNEVTLFTITTDVDGNTYQLVTICNQTWTQQNLNVSKYSDGTPIPQVTDPTQWANLTTGAWCYYNNNNIVNGPVYGKLYNWYAVAGIYDATSAANPALRKKLAPTGWHIPSDAEWSTLINCLDPNADGGNNINVAGGKMKEAGTAHWISPNIGATNESGFTGLPASCRFYDGRFSDIEPNGYGDWWSLLESDTKNAWCRELSYLTVTAIRRSRLKSYGLSVRCVKD